MSNNIPTSPFPHKTCKRWNIPGNYHYLTFSCFHRQPFLSGDHAPHWLAGAITQARTEYHFRLIAYVFMPEHVHLLLWPESRLYKISDILTHIKQPVARTARRHVEQNSPDFLERMTDLQPNGERAIRFWQRGGGHDRNIYTAEELWEKIHTIHNNPVKHKLVSKPEDWIWSSAPDYAGERKGPLPVDNNNLPWTR